MNTAVDLCRNALLGGWGEACGQNGSTVVKMDPSSVCAVRFCSCRDRFRDESVLPNARSEIQICHFGRAQIEPGHGSWIEFSLWIWVRTVKPHCLVIVV